MISQEKERQNHDVTIKLRTFMTTFVRTKGVPLAIKALRIIFIGMT